MVRPVAGPVAQLDRALPSEGVRFSDLFVDTNLTTNGFREFRVSKPISVPGFQPQFRHTLTRLLILQLDLLGGHIHISGH